MAEAVVKSRSTSWSIPVLIALLTFAVFSPALWNGFVTWDDEENLVNNPHYRGLGWPQLRWMFTTTLMGHWIPLTWLSFGLDYLLWGMNPVGYHLSNLVLHAANAAVFYLLARRLLRLAIPESPPTPLHLGAAAAALFFALHPLRAESVAWVTERRDVLAGLFFLLALLTYLQACSASGPRRRRLLAASLACYALALTAKAIVITLPLVLLLLDLYPLRRLSARWRDWAAPSARRIWLEKVPYLLLGAAGAGTTVYAVLPHLNSFDSHPVLARVAMASYALAFYVWKTLLPLGLLPLYELPRQVHILDPPFLLSSIVVAGITGALILLRHRWPAGLAVWVAYVLTLAPVSGFPFHSGYQLANDRYSYLACLGWALLVGAGVSAGARAGASGTLRPALARAAAGAGALWLLGLGTLTWQQVQIWRDTESLWTYAIALDPGCAVCYHNLGVLLDSRGQSALAVEYLQQAVALRPDRVKSQWKIGEALLHAGRPAEAIEHFRQVLTHPPADDAEFVRRHGSLGVALLHAGRPAEAIAEFRKVLERDPADAGMMKHLAVALMRQGKPGEAVEYLRRATELKPEFARAHLTLAQAYLSLGDTRAAYREYEVAKRLDPGLARELFSPGQR